MPKLFEFALRRTLPWLGLWGVALGLAGCSGLSSLSQSMPSVESLVTPYRVDIIQGNFVSKEQAAAIKPGMPRAQVRDTLGSPLLTSVFHADRWDYVFTYSRSGQPKQQRKLTVFFKDDVLERIESDDLPSEAEFVASIEPRKRDARTPVLEASEQALKEFADRNAATAPVVAPTPAPPIANYPPLEAAPQGVR